MHVRQRESLGKVFDTARLDNLFFINFAIKIDHGPVGTDRARSQVNDVLIVLEKRDFHVTVSSSFLS
ncbi:MAG: hypothetical protein DMG40_22025 [Acidobacteria bacterium]|nr:MAG: hypothetical protein DMG40_22025 [Acidobacteriota bacterium]